MFDLYNSKNQKVTERFYKEASESGAKVFSIKLRPGIYPKWELWNGYIPEADYYTFSPAEANELLAELEKSTTYHLAL